MSGFATDARALEEALRFPARLLPGLPVATRFALQGLGIAWEITWTSERSLSHRRGILFDGDEVAAIAIAVEAERLWPADLKGYCLRKLHDPSFLVTELLVLGGAQPAGGPPWSLERVLRWLDLELCGLELCGTEIGSSSVPPRSASRAA